MESQDLKTLEANARRVLETGGEAKKAEATAVLTAIDEERMRRTTEERERRQVAKEAVRDKVKDLGLFDRVVLAFEELPPADWEVEVLRAIAANPGTDFHHLARATGRREGGYINLAVGSLCSAREHFLGVAPPSQDRKGEKNYSSLIIDFSLHKEPDGSQWHGWTLKPEVEAALRHLKVI
jgi:hypothetical protein